MSNRSSTLRLLLGAVAVSGFLLWGTGCSTPQSRIAKNPELFASYPLSVQERIRAGEVDVGFDPQMVIMALGKPARSYMRTTRSGQSEVWAYTDYRYENEQQLVDAEFRYKDSNGIVRTGRDKVWANVRTKIEFETMRVEFVGNRVVAVERVE